MSQHELSMASESLCMCELLTHTTTIPLNESVEFPGSMANSAHSISVPRVMFPVLWLSPPQRSVALMLLNWSEEKVCNADPASRGQKGLLIVLQKCPSNRYSNPVYLLQCTTTAAPQKIVLSIMDAWQFLPSKISPGMDKASWPERETNFDNAGPQLSGFN